MLEKYSVYRFCLISLFVCFSIDANASQQKLEQFFTEVATLTADFTQHVVDETGMQLELSVGRLSLSRPGKFRWDYAADDEGGDSRGIQIVADGESIFLYDPDLEQVTQRSLVNALGQVPSLLLVQTGTNIQQHFSITNIGNTDKLSWVLLKPKAEDAGFQSIMIGFFNASLAKIVLVDGLGNETRLTLSNVLNNPVLPAKRFKFVVPQGADLLRG